MFTIEVYVKNYIMSDMAKKKKLATKQVWNVTHFELIVFILVIIITVLAIFHFVPVSSQSGFINDSRPGDTADVNAKPGDIPSDLCPGVNLAYNPDSSYGCQIPTFCEFSYRIIPNGLSGYHKEKQYLVHNNPQSCHGTNFYIRLYLW